MAEENEFSNGQTIRIFHSLGQLENSVSNLSDDIKNVLTNQARADAKSDQHMLQDEQTFTLIRSGLGDLRDRITRVEMGSDAIESHGQAIVSLEQRMSTTEESIRTRQIVEDRIDVINRRWRNGIIATTSAVAGAGAGAAAEGGKFWKLLLSVFK